MRGDLVSRLRGGACPLGFRSIMTRRWEGANGAHSRAKARYGAGSCSDQPGVLMAVAAELRDLLSLQDCRFVRDPPSGKGAWIEADGTVRLNPLRWPTAVVGLPTLRLIRFSVGSWTVAGLAPGRWRNCLR